MNLPPSRLPSAPQVLLGLFVIGQLLCLAFSNVSGLLLWARPELARQHGSLRVASSVADEWGLMTGQVQNWRLFAPQVPTVAVFLDVELHWDGLPGAVRLGSLFEPADPRRYFHPFGSSDRLFHYESRLGWALLAWDEKAVARRPDEWQRYLAADVRRQWPALRAYLRWRLAQHQRDHPDLPPPHEAVLLVRLYPTPPPGELLAPRGAPVEMPLARWRPGRDAEPGGLPVEPYDHVQGRFTTLLLEK